MKHILLSILAVIVIFISASLIRHEFYPHLETHNAEWCATVPDETKEIRKCVYLLVQCLKDHSEEWSMDDKYTLDHTSGLRIWVANRAFGLDVHSSSPTGKFSIKERTFIWAEAKKHVEAFNVKDPLDVAEKTLFYSLGCEG